MSEELFDDEIYTMTDEDGNEVSFRFAGSCEYNGATYYAVIPVDDVKSNPDEIEYTILKSETDDEGDEIFVTVDDDDEFDAVADIFEDELFSEIDYDADEE